MQSNCLNRRDPKKLLTYVKGGENTVKNPDSKHAGAKGQIYYTWHHSALWYHEDENKSKIEIEKVL